MSATPPPTPRPAATSETIFKVFLFTDIVGSTDLKRRLGNEVAAGIISKHDELFRHCLGEHGGAERDHAGDGFFATFDRPSGAVKCALAFQQGLDKLDIPEKIKVRTGVHMGEIVRLAEGGTGEGQDKLVGIAIDTSARIMGLALGGQILMTRNAFDIAREQVLSTTDGQPVEWRAHGPYLFKGIEHPMDVYEAGIPNFSPLTPPPDSEKAKRVIAQGDEMTLGWRPAKGHAIPNRPNWELVDKLGEGAFGEVWLATHKKVKDRHVFKFCFQPDRLKGLRREVVLFRLLQESLGHREDIAQILDWQFEEAPYFLESDYTEGGDLTVWAKQQGGIEKVALEARLDIIAQVADALGAAHSVGVLHKDIKPSNILLFKAASSGKPQIRLTDFGIGLITDRQALLQRGITATGLTMSALVSPTNPQSGEHKLDSGAGIYMAPELIEGRPATMQSDIYALGIMLYQMVIGNLSRALAPGWERDVEDEFLREDIALCVDGKPARRLASVMDLAQRLRTLDIRRKQRDAERREKEEIERAKVHAERAKSRRLGGLLGLLVVVVGVAIAVFYVTLLSARQEISDARKLAVDAQAALQAEKDKHGKSAAQSGDIEERYIKASLELAALYAEVGQYAKVETALDQVPEAKRGPEWQQARRLAHPELATLTGHTGSVTAAAFSPDGARAATASEDMTARVWDAATGKVIATLAGHESVLTSARFSADGARVITASKDKKARIWDANSGKEAAQLTGHEKAVTDAAFSADGKRAVTASEDGTARVWDAATGAAGKTLTGDGAALACAGLSADGKRVVAGGAAGFARVWDADSGKELAKLVGHKGKITSAAFSPDGLLALTAGEDGAKIWDAKTGKEKATLGGDRPVLAARFTSDGRGVVLAEKEGGARAYDAESGRETATLARYDGAALAFSPDGRKLATATAGNSAKIWGAEKRGQK